MKIGVYGCSWCAGVAPNNFGWPKNLAQMLPEHEINDYSLGGFSIEAILYWFEQFKDHNDINIVKLTTPYRLTIISEDAEVKRTQVTENYSTWDKNFTETMIRIHPNSPPQGAGKLHRIYYKYYNQTVGLITAHAIAEYLKNHKDVHMIFKHQSYDKHHPDISIATQNFIPSFKSYIIDDGQHLSYEGAQIEAEYIKNYLINNQLIT